MPISSQRCAELLSGLDFLLGTWSVTGRVHGAPATGTATARRILDGGWVEYREILDGYEDLCLYGVDAVSGDRVVHHFTGDGRVDIHPVLPLAAGGFHWVPVGGGPVVRLVPEPGGWRCEVGRFDATDLDVVLRYR